MPVAYDKDTTKDHCDLTLRTQEHRLLLKGLEGAVLQNNVA
jgi:hypothetical protein